jgi:hypothetical protein
VKRMSLFPVLALLAACGATPPPSAPVDDSLAPSFGHLDGLPATSGALVCGFVADLDELLGEFDHQVAPFDDERLNRALASARVSVVEARDDALVPQLTQAARDLRSAMRELEKGASLSSVSGNGFADDLASLGSFFAERFTQELIEMASVLGVSPDVISDATSDFEGGVAARGEEEWERSLRYFGQAIRKLEHQVEIGTPCG